MIPVTLQRVIAAFRGTNRHTPGGGLDPEEAFVLGMAVGLRLSARHPALGANTLGTIERFYAGNVGKMPETVEVQVRQLVAFIAESTDA